MGRYNKYRTKQCTHTSWWLVLGWVTTKEYHPCIRFRHDTLHVNIELHLHLHKVGFSFLMLTERFHLVSYDVLVPRLLIIADDKIKKCWRSTSNEMRRTNVMTEFSDVDSASETFSLRSSRRWSDFRRTWFNPQTSNGVFPRSPATGGGYLPPMQ